MRRLFVVVLFLVPFAFVPWASSQKPAVTTPVRPAVSAMNERLPVRKVVLYKNGVGYFEHAGRVQGSQRVNIDFTTAQLDDVIKSLTVIDLNKGRVSGIRYNSIAPLEERLRTLRLSLGEQTNQLGFLYSLRGARLEVRNGTLSATGRLLSVESRARVKNDQKTEVTELSLVTDAGEVRTFEVTPSTGIRIADADLHEEVNRYLGLIGSARERDVRRMTISAEGEGERSLFVSYISEVPVWKSTYRIVLPSDPKGKALLQGWAIVDNTVGEDWKNIELSLIAGAPQSFVQQISQPQYIRRPVVALPTIAQLSPQSHESTMNAPAPASPVLATSSQVYGYGVGAGVGGGVGRGDGRAMGGVLNSMPMGNSSLSGQVNDDSGAVIPNTQIMLSGPSGTRTARSDSSGHYVFSNIPDGTYTLIAEAAGFSKTVNSNVYVPAYNNRELSFNLTVSGASETIEVSAGGGGGGDLRDKASDLLESAESEAEGQDIGDLFEYKLKQRVTIGKNQSALVPIVQAHIDADRVSLWNATRGRALRAIWVNNTSGLSLDAGTFNVLDHDTFAGEGLLEIIRPGEKRLLSYAVDQSVKIEAESESNNEQVTRVRIVRGTMTTTHGVRDSKKYTIRNNDDSARSVVIEHPVTEGWKIVSEAKPEESSSSFHRFRVAVEPHATAELEVEEFKPQETTFQLSGLNDDMIAMFIKQKSINGAIEGILRKVTAQKTKLNGFENTIRQRQKEIADISTDQNRLRENMKALKGSTEEKTLLQRYATQLNTQEDRLDAVRKELVALESQRDAARGELARIIEEISMDVTL